MIRWLRTQSDKQWVRWIVVLISLSIYILTFFPLYSLRGMGILAMSTLPVVVTGWLFGLRAGILAGLLIFPLNTLLVNMTGDPGWDVIFRHSGGVGSIAAVAVGAIIGRLHDLGSQLKRELAEHRRAEEVLRLTEARFRIVTEGSLAGVYITQDGKFEYVNPTLANVFGYHPDEMIGHMGPLDVIHPDSQGSVTEIIQARISGEVAAAQYTFPGLHKSGNVVQCEVLGRRVEYQGRPAIIGTLLDITERKQAHDILEQRVIERTTELEAAKNRVEAILHNSVDGILFTHADLSIQQTNLAFNRLFNSQPDTYIDHSLLDLIVMDDTEQVQQILQDKMSTHTRHRMETRARRQDGTTFDVELSIGLIKGYGLVCTLRDITERKQAEAVLAAKIQQEREFQAYLKALHDVSIELTQIDDLNTFYQRAVELGLEQLGFERLALFLRNADDGTASGTYGTDQQGQLVDERHVRFTLKPGGIMERAFMRAERFYIDEAVPLYNNLEVVGTGWNAASILWNGIESQGWFVCDNLLTKKPASKVQMEILSLYSMTVGTLLAQKQTQSALVESEARYRLMTENISDVITKVRPDGIRTFSSPSCYALFGYTPEELTGVLILDLVHPDDRAYVQATIQKMFDEAESSWTVAYRARHKNGHFVWVEVTTNIVRDPSTGAVIDIIGVIRDIAERKAAQDRLAEERNLLRRLIDTITEHIYVKDTEHRFVLANEALARSHGLASPDELIGKTDHDLLPWALADEYQAEETKIFQTGQPQVDREEPSTGYSGGFEWALSTKMPLYNLQGELTGLVGINRDITEQKRAEKALRDQHDFLQLVIDSIPHLIMVKDREGTFELVNKTLAQLYKLDRAHMVGIRDADINPNQEQVAFFRQKDQETLASGQPVFIPEETVLDRYYQTNKIPLRNWDGAYNRLLVIASDITERKRAEETLRQALAKEKELGELKTRFVSMASHEFRTPLATILALTETIIAYRQKLSDEQVDQRLGKIQDQVTHLKDIMEDVLQLARIQARREQFNPDLLDLDGLCRSVLDEFQSRPDVSHRLVYTCDDTLREVKLDKRLMRQIINNLVSNAIKYSPADKPVVIQLQHTAEALILTVRDEGIGIPEADLKHLFEPFHRAANVGAISGTGLGLVITKESVEMHGGTITVESQVKVGTTFVVRIPIE